jgi:hypothetical protein
VHLVFDIFQGIGIAAAVGIRPFLPALLVGVLAVGNVEIHFKHTHFSFLQSAPFLLVLVILTVALALVERRLGERARATAAAPAPPATGATPGAAILGVVGAILGALLFAGSLARGHYAAWPGYIGGIICAAIAILATQPLFARVRARLDRDAAGALPFYAEGVAVILAGLSVVAPPVGLIGLLFLLWLLAGGRRREGQKYAGLRILR